jgi:hypothetical protein
MDWVLARLDRQSHCQTQITSYNVIVFMIIIETRRRKDLPYNMKVSDKGTRTVIFNSIKELYEYDLIRWMPLGDYDNLSVNKG